MNIATAKLNDAVIKSTVSKQQLQSRIVHLGFGAFHRAHQGLFTNEMLKKQVVIGVSVKLICLVAKS